MRLFGHPVHPALVAFPLALLALVPALDLLVQFGVSAAGVGTGAAYFCELVGLLGGGVAAAAGFVDLVKIPAQASAAAKAALIHAGLALVSMSLYGVAFAFRGGPAIEPTVAIVALEVAGALCLGATGWFGGHLVFHYRVGVRPVDDDRPIVTSPESPGASPNEGTGPPRATVSPAENRSKTDPPPEKSLGVSRV